MARAEYLLVMLAVCILGMSYADTEFPSLLTALGSKMALADDYYDDDATDDAKPSRCCYPVVWQGRSFHMLSVDSHGGRGQHRKTGPIVSKSVDQFYVDGTNRRLSGFKMAFHGHRRPMNISWIFKIGANRTGDYYIFNKVAKKCQHRTLRNVSWRRQCIPVNATLRGSFSLGPVGGLAVQSWSFGGRSRGAPEIAGDHHPYSRPRVVFGANILVEPKTCIPVVFHEHGFVYRGIDQQMEEHSNNLDIDDTGSLNDDDDYENYARFVYDFLFCLAYMSNS